MSAGSTKCVVVRLCCGFCLPRRIETEDGPRIEAAGAPSIGVRDCVPLGRDIIHSVTNLLLKLTRTIHVYDGDFFATVRNAWEPESLEGRRYDVEKNMRLFEESTGLQARGQDKHGAGMR